MKVAIVGAAGFLGRAVVARMAADHEVWAISRDGDPVAGASRSVASGDLLCANLAELVEGAEIVVNTAACVHRVRQGGTVAAGAAAAMNGAFPVLLAEAAEGAAASIFVQLSSVAAIASTTIPGEVADDATTPRPQSAFGRAKLSADLALSKLAKPGFKVVSLRLPTLYGPGAKAFVGRLDLAAQMGIPLPIKGLHNRRSLLRLENAADAVSAAVVRGHSGSFTVTEGPPISTARFYDLLCRCHGIKARTFGVPSSLLSAAARLMLRGHALSLLGSCAFDGRNFAEMFDWVPPYVPPDI